MADIFNMADTWNNAGTAFSAIKMNVTNTASGAESRLLHLQIDGVDRFAVRKDGNIFFGSDADSYFGAATTDGRTLDWVRDSVAYMRLSTQVTFGGSAIGIGTTATGADAYLTRVASGITGVRGSSTSVGGALSFIEQTAPAAPSTDGVYIYAEDSGGGKTRLMARFATGAAQQIAIEP